jgi:predicted DNA-binding transcriptional regulator AlpA
MADDTPKIWDEGFLRLPQIVAPHGCFPVSRSTWWEGIRQGKYPAPVKLAPRVSAWRIRDIRKLIEDVGNGR